MPNNTVDRLRQRLQLPPGTHPSARRILACRAARALADGCVSLVLPFYLAGLGLSPFYIGVLCTATLLGSGMITLTVGLYAHKLQAARVLLAAALLMTATGLLLVLAHDFWPLMLIAFVGTLNPSNGDVSVFLPMEQSLLAAATPAASRTEVFARYSLLGALAGALGAQAAALPGLAAHATGLAPMTAMQCVFILYGLTGLTVFFIYRRMAVPPAAAAVPHQPLAGSRRIVLRLAALFSLDSFSGGFAVQSLLALWLNARFGLSLAAAATMFFWIGLLTAFSQLAAPKVAARYGLINTMVYTHLPANGFLILAAVMPTLPLAVAMLLLRSALSSMDIPARTSYVMAVVAPAERAAAASVTAVPRSLAAAISPAIAGYLFSVTTFGWPLIICGAGKIVYDLLLLVQFRHVKPPEEQQADTRQ